MKKNIISLHDYCETLHNGYFFDDAIYDMRYYGNFNSDVLLGMVLAKAMEKKIKLTLIDDFDYEDWFWGVYEAYEL